MKHGVRLTAIVIAALAIGMMLGGVSSAKKITKSSRKIAPGVRYVAIHNPHGPWEIRMLKVRMAAASTLDVGLAQDELAGFETTSSMAKRHDAVAAINGDFALSNGRPVMTFAEDGQLAQTPIAWGRNFAVNAAETRSFFGHPDLQVWMKRSGPSGEGHAREDRVARKNKIARVNEGPPRRWQFAEFSSFGGHIERPPRRACSTRLYPNEAWHARAKKPGMIAKHRVDAVKCDRTRLKRRGGVVVSSRRTGWRAGVLSSLSPNEAVTLGWSLGWRGVRDTVGGNPMLVRRGRNAVGRPTSGSYFWGRNPRTGIGATRNGRVLLVVVDGRHKKRSVGMSLRRFARFFVRHHARWALNLDGGGSATMVVKDKIVNKPSGGGERAVSSALLVLEGPDTGEATPYSERAEPDASPWTEIARDPASTGGMAAAALARGLALPSELRRATALFHRARAR